MAYEKHNYASGDVLLASELNEMDDAIEAHDTDIGDLKSSLNYDKTAPQGYILTATNSGDGSEWSPVGLPTDEQTADAVSDWLDDHPESTTTVQDGSLTEAKFTDALKLKTVNNYVTPEMFGAKGDGITDDSAAIQAASEHGALYCSNRTYYIGRSCDVQNSLFCGHFIINKERTITFSKPSGLIISNCEFENDDYYPSTGRGKWMILVDEAKNVIFSNCLVHKGVSAVYLNRCEDVIIANNIFYDIRQVGLSAGGNGYGVLTVESKNISIKNNEFLNVARHSIYLSHDNDSSYNENILIDSNMFKWDAGVVGNTSGFETTINIRPSKNVIISNNVFDNMFGLSGFTVQDIKIDGENVTSGSEKVVIKNNYGVFRNSPRSTDGGIVFFPSDLEQEQAIASNHVTIENNDFTIDKGSTILANAIKNIDIIGNRISYENYFSHNILVYSRYSSEVSPVENIRIDRNVIKNVSNLFNVGDRAKAFGDLIVSNNHCDIDFIGTVANGSSFNKVIITNNHLNNTANRCYFSSSPTAELTMKNNILKTNMALYLNAASVLSTDPCFYGFGYNNANPSGAIPGSIHSWSNGDTYIVDSTGTWRKIAFDS